MLGSGEVSERSPRLEHVLLGDCSPTDTFFFLPDVDSLSPVIPRSDSTSLIFFELIPQLLGT